MTCHSLTKFRVDGYSQPILSLPLRETDVTSVCIVTEDIVQVTIVVAYPPGSNIFNGDTRSG